MARMRRVNVDGVIHTIRAVAPGMQERGYGRIVNIASNAAIGTALPGTTFYAASKAEVLILTRRFAMELGRRGVTVNAVAPGWIVTEMARAGGSEEEFEARVRNMSERTMVGRTGRPDAEVSTTRRIVRLWPVSAAISTSAISAMGNRRAWVGWELPRHPQAQQRQTDRYRRVVDLDFGRRLPRPLFHTRRG
jgi:3-oxoacyl-[acyl-carrier protein] reductase